MVTGTNLLIVYLYVDDLQVTGSNEGEIEEFKKKMKKEFEISDLRLLSYFLGIEFKTIDNGTMMHQTKYAIDLLKKFNMFKCNSIVIAVETRLALEKEGTEELINPTYFKKIVGSLRYRCNTKPNLGFSVGLISICMETPRMPHLLIAKRIIR